MQVLMKNVYIFGAARSGVSAAKALFKKGVTSIMVSQGEPSTWESKSELLSKVPDIKLLSQESCCEDEFSKASLIILSPGIPRNHPLLKSAISKNIPIWSEIELGFRLRIGDAPIIAITGTNGKTTVVTLIGEMLKNAGKCPFVCGNIGTPFCDIVGNENSYDVVAMELSSFQLESIEKFTPDVAAILNVTPNHGERYATVEEYTDAKLNIVKNMDHSKTFVTFDNFWGKYEINGPSLHLLSITSPDRVFEKFSIDKFQLVGKHNLANLMVAISCVRVTYGDECDSGIQKTIDTFSGVDFRLQRVKNRRCTIFNDAKSTNWDATVAAVKSVCETYPDKKIWLVLGGKLRGRSDSLGELIFLFAGVEKYLLIGEASELLKSELDGVAKYQLCDNLGGVKQYIEKEEFDGVLLFSPAFPSFDQFKNYVERGRKFRETFFED